MNFRLKLTGLIFIMLALISTGCTKSGKTNYSKETIKPIFVGYRMVQRKDFRVTREFTASIIPILQAEIRPKVAGWLSKVYVNTGDKVQQGDVVAEMDHVQLLQAVRQAEANVERQKTIAQNDRVNLFRSKNLFSQGFIPQQQFENIRTLYLSDQATLQAMKALLLTAKENLSDSFLKAPFSGIITSRSLDPGAYLSTAVTTTSPPIVTLADSQKLKVIVNVTEQDAPKVHQGQAAFVTVDAYPEKTFQGVVKRIAGSLDPLSRTLSIELHVNNAHGTLLPGMFARVSLLFVVHRSALVIPLEALVSEGKHTAVWVLEDSPLGTIAKQVSVGLGDIQGNEVEVLQGLTGPERIVTDGKELIRPGVALQAHPSLFENIEEHS